jgi:hypothetical protein
MDNVEKLRVLLQHWIEHNDGHVEEFEKWRATMTEDAKQSLAAHIGDAVAAMAIVNEKLTKALDEAGGPVKKEGGDHHHHHH